jgi:hypothetical protein
MDYTLPTLKCNVQSCVSPNAGRIRVRDLQMAHCSFSFFSGMFLSV